MKFPFSVYSPIKQQKYSLVITPFFFRNGGVTAPMFGEKNEKKGYRFLPILSVHINPNI